MAPRWCFCFVAGATEGSEQYSPPGGIHGPAQDLDRLFFHSNRPYVNGPFADARGSFIAAHCPVGESAELPGPIWIAMDFPADAWLDRFLDARWQILLGLVAVEMLLLGILLGLVQSERSFAKAMEELDILQGERNRFARDLHDGLGQTLTALGLMSTNLALDLEQTDPLAAAKAREIAARTREAFTEARETAHALTPALVRESGLAGALQWLAKTAKEHMRCECELETAKNVVPASDETAFALFQICREALHNAVRHGQATKVIFRLGWINGNEANLEIENNGRGMSQKVDAQEGGFGLRMMFARVQQFEGRIGFRKTDAGGVVLTCRFPAKWFIKTIGLVERFPPAPMQCG